MGLSNHFGTGGYNPAYDWGNVYKFSSGIIGKANTPVISSYSVASTSKKQPTDEVVRAQG